jgi:hypothetical protein
VLETPRRGRHLLSGLLRPRVFISTVVSIAIIAGLLAFADLGKLANVISGLRPASWERRS